MNPLSDAVICVVDHGLFLHIAQCISEQCGKVYYCGPSEKVMAKLEDAMVGDGFHKIERVQSLWEIKDRCDAFVFPDIGFGGEQTELISQGKAVWGHHGADEIEVIKGSFLNTLKNLSMEVPPHRVMHGMANLRNYLREKTDMWVKISKYRGDWETFHFRNWTLDEATLDCHSYRLGPVKEHIMFYVFDKIETKIEDGIDSWCIDGEWPKTVLHAMEKKDKSLLGAMQSIDDVHEDVRHVNELYGPVLKGYGYRGAFSTEVRIGEAPYFIDPTCRFGSPPSQLQTVLIKNLPEVIYHGAHGECVEPEFDDPIGAQVLITSDREKDEWLTFEMPEELRPYVKSAFSCEIDGNLTICPNPLENWAGWLVATGSTIPETISRLKERKEMLPAGFECDLTSLHDLLRELDEAAQQDIEVTDQKIPDPSIVLDS